MRGTPDPLTFFRALEEKPFSFDFFQALRRIECLHPDKPRLGKGLRPTDEAVRIAQEPSMTFAPSSLSSFHLPVGGPGGGAPGRMEVRFFGLLGPNGPLPLHLTEYARARLLHAGDATFVRFLDMFNHRFLLLFYRAWAQARPTVSLDRPSDDRFTIYIGSFQGLAGGKMRNRDEIGDFAKLFFAGLLGRQVRNRDGLVALLSSYFRVAVRIEEFVGHWMRLPKRDRTSLSSGDMSTQLGGGAVLGARVWDRQHKFRIWLGPLSLAQYEAFLPGGKAIGQLVAWVRQYFCFELEWDVRLTLARDAVPKTSLGQFGRLGWTSWLGARSVINDATELILDAERLCSPQHQTTKPGLFT
jgi:type VI secretion system protein ImpH